MPAFLKDISAFYGTGERNQAGQTLEEFLEEYDPYKYKNPCQTADVLVVQHPADFCQVESGLRLLLIKRGNHPCIGYWALPGGFVNVDEDIETAAKRELMEETGLMDVAVEQLYTWGEYQRDPRARIVTTTYLSLVEEEKEVRAGDDAGDAAWVEVALKKGEEIQEVQKDRVRICKKYEIALTNEEKAISLSAVVEVSENKDGFLKERAYKVISSRGIAFDHSRIIVQALLYVDDILKRG